MVTFLAHEWIARDGGSENVLEQIRLASPADARLFCLWNDDPLRFPNAEESILSRRPLRGKKALSLPLMPTVWRRQSLNGIDRVIASSHAFSHHIASHAANAGIPAFAYVHSPARYVWTPELDVRGNSGFVRAASRFLRKIDRRTVSERVSFAANSAYVARRVESCWGVEAEVVYPPVDVTAIQKHSVDRNLPGSDEGLADRLPPVFVLGASRLVAYKKVESAIRVGELLDMPVVIAGTGPELARIQKLADDSTVPVFLLGRVSDPLLRELYLRACLYVFMAVEDFGIMPVEAMAAGTPVLVNHLGGAAESVGIVEGGATADPLSDASLLAGAETALSTAGSGNESKAAVFSNESFRRRFRNWVGQSVEGSQ